MTCGQGKFCFAIDRGGTFTDIFARCPDGRIRTMKLLSVDPSSYSDAPREGIRRILQQELGTPFDPRDPLSPEVVEWIRMGTTVATNALLERKGEPTALAITKGFRDLLFIGNQSRPNIFDLKVECPEVLYSMVIEVEERVVMTHPKCQMRDNRVKKKSVTGDEVEVWQELNQKTLVEDLKKVLSSGITSLAVVLLNSYIFPDHELKVASVAQNLGFKYITISSQVMPMIKAVPRGLTTTADAYLTPHVQKYIRGFFSGFDQRQHDKMKVMFMRSDGGLSPVDSFNGSKAILSGPAGGVIGYAYTTRQEVGEDVAVIGFDMGGTSTDVSRFDTHLEHTYEAITAGIPIQAPQLDITTVAAGGGSMLMFRSGLFVVGPESAGAHPGPSCYRNNGPLTVTDANLCLGRVLPQFFPHIFGPNKNEPLDKEITISSFKSLSKTINDYYEETGVSQELSGEQVAMGFIRVANEAMARPIRAITEGKGYDSSLHVLACFGGAGGQHACAVARSLGIKRIFIHRFAGILSAYGMALADVVHEEQEPSTLEYSLENFSQIDSRLDVLKQKCLHELLKQGFHEGNIAYEEYLNLRYEKTDFGIMCQPKKSKSLSEPVPVAGDFHSSFVEKYQQEFGFSLPNRKVIVDDIRIRGIGRSGVDILPKIADASDDPRAETVTECFFEETGYADTPVYLLEKLLAGHKICGPSIISDSTSTILVEPGCSALITKKGNVIIHIEKELKSSLTLELDLIQLSIFSHRFMSIAEQMGRVLQRTAISTNIKERLDFSCALFGPDGGLVSNAPHIPVHLGAMQKAVQFQIQYLKDDINRGDVILSNHPMAGGSHLPDLTVITPVFYSDSEKPVFFVASRGHHADIGGKTPGSMPPDSKSIDEEGATFISFKLLKRGVFQEEILVEKLMAPGEVEGCSGSRCLSDCISDLQAQVAANNKGIQLVQQLIEFHGLQAVQAYMKYIQENAEVAVRDMLREIASQEELKILQASDFMDDGTEIKLKISINGMTGDATFDFTGTGLEVIGNLNAPEAVSLSAIIYCLRCMVGHDVPLNQGCLTPIRVIIPNNSILSPSLNAAVVGGNVETSQRVVDVIFRAFEACSASQGTMNNITFGDESHGYYETVAGGSGAGPSWDGRSTIHTHMTNTRMTDPEIIEKRYPVVVNKFHVNPGTGGRGMFKGGDGSLREMIFRKNMTLSVLTERRVFPPYGLKGGENGSRGKNTLIFRNGRKVNLGPKCSVEVSAGDLYRLETPGAGGFGSPPQK